MNAKKSGAVMSASAVNAAPRAKRVTVTLSLSDRDPLDRRFLEMYEDVGRSYLRRQELVRSLLRLGLAAQAAASSQGGGRGQSVGPREATESMVKK